MPRPHAHLRPLPSAAGATDDAPPDLDEAFRQYSGYVATIAWRILGRDDELDDVVQDVFLDAVRGLRRLREPAATKGWLATVTVRVAMRRLRRRKLARFLGLDEAWRGDEPRAPGASPEQQALLASVYRALDDLPVSERVAWTLRTLEGRELGEVAALCGCSLATVKRRVAAARQALERRFEHD